MSAPLSIWTNGVEATTIAPMSRAFHYGDGVFRTLLRHQGRVLDAGLQIDRLLVDAEKLGLVTDPVLRARLREEVDAISANAHTVVIKLMLVRSGEGRGYWPCDAGVDRHLMSYQPPAYPASYWDRGIVLQRSTLVLAEQPALAGIKHLNRLEQILAYRSAPAEAQEVLLANPSGHWICGGRTNVFIVRDGCLLTPELDRQGVRGHMRERVLAAASALGIEYRIGPVTDTLIENTDEMFVTNSLIGIWPVQQFEQRSLSSPGAITQRLVQAIAHPRLTAP